MKPNERPYLLQIGRPRQVGTHLFSKGNLLISEISDNKWRSGTHPQYGLVDNFVRVYPKYHEMDIEVKEKF